MRVHLECVPCLMDVAVKQIELSTDDEDLQLETISRFSKLLASEIIEAPTPAHLGSRKNEVIRKCTSNLDPYIDLKICANRAADKLKPFVEELVSNGNVEDRLRLSLTVATIANSMEFGVSGHEFDPSGFRDEFELLFERGLDYDDSSEVASRILSGGEILYLTDNCGEIVLDSILMRAIKESGAEIYISAKSIPVQDDVTLEVAKKLGIDRFGELLSAGDRIGVDLARTSRELKEKLGSADLVLSKGMGNYETLSEIEDELKGRLVYLLRAKCNPVADSLGVERGALVIKLAGN